MPDLKALLTWLAQPTPQEDLAALPEHLLRIAAIFETRGVNLGLRAHDPREDGGISLTDAVVLARIQGHRFGQQLLHAAMDDILAVAGSQKAALRMSTTEVVAAIRRGVQQRCAADGRAFSPTHE